MNKRISFVLVLSYLLFSGCASLVSGTTQPVSIDSDPQGATVVLGCMKKVDGKKTMVKSRVAGQTPITVALPRKDGMIELSKEGYESQLVDLKKTGNPWVFGDILLTSPLSTCIDTSTGACFQYKPGKYMVTLTPTAEKSQDTNTQSTKMTPQKTE
jgi:hypothetical protein